MAAAMANRRASSGVSSTPAAYACLAKIGIAPKPAADRRTNRSPSRSRGAPGEVRRVTRREVLGERATLVEAGAGVDPVLEREHIDRTHDRNRDSDGDESDHATTIGHCAPEL